MGRMTLVAVSQYQHRIWKTIQWHDKLRRLSVGVRGTVRAESGEVHSQAEKTIATFLCGTLMIKDVKLQKP